MAGIPLSPLVGRERELAVLRERLDAALDGHGSLVLIGGEAGIGKTALAEASCREATERGALLLVGRCYDLTETPPYGLWIDLFQHWHTDSGRPPLPNAFADRGTVGEVASQTALFQQVLGFFITLAASRPLILLLDDLHWADPASLDLLRSLTRSAATLPLLVLATYRADELTRRHPLYQLLPTLVRESAATRIDLRRIEPADICALTDARYALPEPDAARLGTYLDARSEGNPFFLGELLQTLEAERALRPTTSGWSLGDLREIGVPALLRQVIDGRVARLEDEVQRLLAVASVIGHEVPLTLWASVAERDEEALLDAVEQAVEAHLLAVSQGGARMQFVHALIREALYEGIPPMRRRIWHRRAGEVLAAQTNPDPDAVARHFRKAGDARAYDWLVRAGDRAQGAYAFVIAADRFEAALALLETSDATAGERGSLLRRLARLRRFSDARRGIADLDEAIALARQGDDRILLGNALMDRGMLLNFFAGGLRRGGDDLEAGAATLRMLSEADRARLQTAPPLLELADARVAEALLVLHLADVGRFAEARALGERALAGPASTTDASMVDVALARDGIFGLAQAYAALGLPDQARATFAHARGLYGAIGHHMLLGDTLLTELDQALILYHADAVGARRRCATQAEAAYAKAGTAAPDLQPRIARVPLLLLEGEWAAARQVLDAMPRPLGPFPSLMRATIAARQGEVDPAWQRVRAILAEGPETEPGESDFSPANRLQRLAATLALNAGDLPMALRWLDAHDRWLAWSGAVPGQSEGAALWAQYYRAAGDAKRAHAHAERALAHATEPRQPLALIAAHRLLGELDTEAGRFDDAEKHLGASLALTAACQAPYERALTLLVLAELRAATDETERARTLIDEVQSICTPLDAKPALARADALRAHLDAAKEFAPAHPAGLSAREVEVLRLLAVGKTNRDIADALFLSEHTVRVHVRNIMTKTNTGNRTAAAAFARDHRLA